MRAMLVVLTVLVVGGCGQDEDAPLPGADAEPPPPDVPDGVQYVEEGRYELHWDGRAPFTACDELELRDAGYALTFLGADPSCVELAGSLRGLCRCYPAQDGYREWCLCPGNRSLIAAFIDAEPVDQVGHLNAYRVGN